MHVVVAPLFLLIFILMIVGVFVLIYLALYRYNLNKALKENNGKHVALPDVRSAISAILIIILFFNIFSLNSQVNDLENEISNLNRNFDSEISNLQNAINELNNKLDDMEKANSLIPNYSYKVDNFNTNDMTANLILELIPKSYTKDTKISVNINNKDVELQDKGGKYAGSIKVNIFDKFEEDTLIATISNGNVMETCELTDFYVEPLWKYVLPSISAKAPVDFTSSKDKLNIEGDIYVGLYSTDSYKFTDAYMDILVNNKSVKNIDMKFSENEMDYYWYLDESVEIASTNDIVDVCVIATDSAGYTHKYTLVSWQDDGYAIYEDGEEIFDKNGNKLAGELE